MCYHRAHSHGITNVFHRIRLLSQSGAAAAVSSSVLPAIEVVRDTQMHVIPAIGDVVTCKVTKVNERVASVDILLVGTRLIKENFSGTIRYVIVMFHVNV
jgi:exosome complex RNA-binding protein Csl4